VLLVSTSAFKFNLRRYTLGILYLSLREALDKKEETEVR
jgi:hypothetical protein